MRKGSGIKTAKDLVGKRFGAPGLNAVLHVVTRRWLMEQGVDPKSVNFVEATFPVHGDLLKSGQIDAVVTADPFLSRIRDAGEADEILNVVTTLPDNAPPVMYVTTREWAQKNPDIIKAFRASIDEAAAFIAANPDKAREAIGAALKLPPPVVKTLALAERADHDRTGADRVLDRRDEQAEYAEEQTRSGETDLAVTLVQPGWRSSLL